MSLSGDIISRLILLELLILHPDVWMIFST